MAPESAKPGTNRPNPWSAEHADGARPFWRTVNALGLVAPLVLGGAILFAIVRFTGRSDTPARPAIAPATSADRLGAAAMAAAAESSASESNQAPSAPSQSAPKQSAPSHNQPASNPPAPLLPAGSPGVALSENAPPQRPSGPVTVSPQVAQTLRLSGDTPAYPAIAQAAHLQGTVTLQALIGPDGTVQDLHAISGPAILQNAAVTAVRTWRYKPWLLNGHPVSFHTEISVNFEIVNHTPPQK